MKPGTLHNAGLPGVGGLPSSRSGMAGSTEHEVAVDESLHGFALIEFSCFSDVDGASYGPKVSVRPLRGAGVEAD